MKRNAFHTLPALLMLTVTITAMAQASQPERAYRSISDSATPTATRIGLAEAFLTSSDPAFLNSMYRDTVFLALLQLYIREKDWVRTLNTVDRMDQLAPTTPRERKLQILADAMTIAADEVKDTGRRLAFAEKIVALDPENINALRTLATVVPPGQGPAAQEAVTNRLLEYGGKILALRKPERMPDDEWVKLRAETQEQNHLLVFRKLMNSGDYVRCAAAFEDLIKLLPRDAASQYRLGVCYLARTNAVVDLLNAANLELSTLTRECNANRSCGSPENAARRMELVERQNTRMRDFEGLRDRAIEALATSVAIGGIGTEKAARTDLERAYRSKNSSSANPLEGLDELIAEKKRQVADK